MVYKQYYPNSAYSSPHEQYPSPDHRKILKEISYAISEYHASKLSSNKKKPSKYPLPPPVLVSERHREEPRHETPHHLKKIVLSPHRRNHTFIIEEKGGFNFWIFLLYCVVFLLGFFLGYWYFSFKRNPTQSYYKKYPSILDTKNNVF